MLEMWLSQNNCQNSEENGCNNIAKAEAETPLDAIEGRNHMTEEKKVEKNPQVAAH